MTSRPQRQAKPSAPRLYLVTPVTGDTRDLARELGEALGAADIAAVLLRLSHDSDRTLINRIKDVAPGVQKAGAALILDGYPHLVTKSGADGSHLTGIETFSEAAETLKPERIAGAGGLHTRHDAMVAAERGADYVMFGEPDEDGTHPSFDAIAERIAWWAQVFETPCVGYARGIDEIPRLAEAGADFVAIGDFVFADKAGTGPAVAQAASRLARAETQA